MSYTLSFLPFGSWRSFCPFKTRIPPADAEFTQRANEEPTENASRDVQTRNKVILWCCDTETLFDLFTLGPRDTR